MEHPQGEVFADEQVAPPVRRRAVAAGEFHQQVPALGVRGELGVLAAGQRTRLTGQRARGESGVVRAGERVRLPGEEAGERLLTDDQVADAVFAPRRERDQVVLVAPVADAPRQAQFGIPSREAAPHVALWPHVVREGRQAHERLPDAGLALQPVPVAREKVEDPVPVRAAALVHANDRSASADARDLARHGVPGRHAAPESPDARPRFAHEARHRGLRDSEFPLNLRPGQKPAPPQEREELIDSPHRPLRSVA